MPRWPPHARQRIVHKEWCDTVFFSLFDDISMALHVDPSVCTEYAWRCDFRLHVYSVHEIRKSCDVGVYKFHKVVLKNSRFILWRDDFQLRRFPDAAQAIASYDAET